MAVADFEKWAFNVVKRVVHVRIGSLPEYIFPAK